MNIYDNVYMGGVQVPNNAPNEGVGPMARVFTYNIVPLTKQTNNIAVAAHPTSGTAMTLAAGTGTTAGTAPDGSGRTVISLDVPRNVRLTPAAGNITGNVTIVGFDTYGVQLSQKVAGDVGNVVATLKTYKSVLSITPDFTDGNLTIAAGTGDVLGLPFCVAAVEYVVANKWAGVLAQDAGTFVAAVTTDPATNATGDTRGTYAPSSAPNGSRRLTITVHLPAAAVGPDATYAGALGVTQA